MTGKEAKKIIEEYFKGVENISPDLSEALGKAYTFLDEIGEWIPVKDPAKELPRSDKLLWVWDKDGCFNAMCFWDEPWDGDEKKWEKAVSNVVAYMPYWVPEYKPV